MVCPCGTIKLSTPAYWRKIPQCTAISTIILHNNDNRHYMRHSLQEKELPLQSWQTSKSASQLCIFVLEKQESLISWLNIGVGKWPIFTNFISHANYFCFIEAARSFYEFIHHKTVWFLRSKKEVATKCRAASSHPPGCGLFSGACNGVAIPDSCRSETFFNQCKDWKLAFLLE